jgi:hypothetical protein
MEANNATMQVHGLQVSFKQLHVLKGVDFDVARLHPSERPYQKSALIVRRGGSWQRPPAGDRGMARKDRD